MQCTQFSWKFYLDMRNSMSENAYLKAFELAKYLETQPIKEWKSIIEKACSIREWEEGYGWTIEHWFKSHIDLI